MDDEEVVRPAASASRQETDKSRLITAVARLAQPGFAVIDGGHWTDVRAELQELGLTARSLFLGAGQDVEAAGPWLLALGQRPGVTDAVVSFVEDKPAAVFWGCHSGEQVLWHHLRTLNQARLPRAWEPTEDRDESVKAAGADGADVEDTRSEVVLFRHWDPRVLSIVLPVLDEAQYARVLGPAEGAVFIDPKELGGVGLRRMARLPDLPEAPQGMLTLGADQVAALDEGMQQRSRRRIAVYLADAAPDQVKHRDPAQVYMSVVAYEAEANGLGVQSELGRGLWAYLQVTSNVDLSRDAFVRRFLGDRSKGPTVDDRLKALYQFRGRLLREQV